MLVSILLTIAGVIIIEVTVLLRLFKNENKRAKKIVYYLMKLQGIDKDIKRDIRIKYGVTYNRTMKDVDSKIQKIVDDKE